MILRAIRVRAVRAELEAFRITLETELRRVPSLLSPTRLHLGVRGNGRVLDAAVLVFWQAAEDVAASDRRGDSPLALARRAGLEAEASHFEVDETIQRRSTEPCVAIRIATGRFSKPGADIEMQDLLRQRVPEIGEEMTEAYVGRCLVERMVEVTFVSAWRRLPADRRLEDPFWPDIALRYDEFSVEVFTPLEAVRV